MYDKRPGIFMAFNGEAPNPVKHAVDPILTFIVMVILMCIAGYLFVNFIEPHFYNTVIEFIKNNYPFEILH